MFNSTDHRILSLALPSIVQNITVPLLGLCDVAIMGHVGGAAHIGAIAVGSMIFNVMYWLFGFLRMCTSGLTSQALGARRLGTASALLVRSVVIALAMGFFFVAVQQPLGRLAFWLMQPSADVEALATPYYNICIWGAPAVLGLYAMTGWFIGMQNTRTPMLVALVQNVVNIATSLLLVVGAGMGVEGVALGTVIAQYAGFLLALSLLMRFYGKTLRQHRPRLTDVTSQLRRFFSLNADIFLRTLCMVAVNLYFTTAGAAQGAQMLAANTLLMQLFMLFSYVMDGFAFAGETLSGRLAGAHNVVGLRSMVSRLFGWGCVVTALFTLVYWVGGTAFLHLLTTDDSVITTAAAYLPWAVLVPVAGMAAFVWDGVFIGLTRSRGMLTACLVASVAFFALWFALRMSLGNHALWIALLVYLALRGVVQTLLWRRDCSRRLFTRPDA